MGPPVPVGVPVGPPDGVGVPASGWRPVRVLGATSAMSLALPDARPTPSQLYAPRGVLLEADPATEATRIIAADTGNHRIMVWLDLPDVDGADCAVVIGQPDPVSEGPNAGGRGPRRGLHLPTGLAVVPSAPPAGAPARAALLVADGWNHRIVGYDLALDRHDPEPVWLFGQDDLDDVEPNRGGDVDGAGLYWPFGVAWDEGWLWVADTGNRRVLGWHGLPQAGARRAADVVLGQGSPDARQENRGGAVGADSFRWPHGIAIVDGVLWVADAGNHRLLGWYLPVPGDRPADLVLGQASFDATREMPHVPQGPAALRFPYAVTGLDDELLVADTANNRVLGWDLPVAGASGAQRVLGQDDVDAAGENRWTAVTRDSLCWPYGLSGIRTGPAEASVVTTSGDTRRGADGAAGPVLDPPSRAALLAIADSGNNRVVLWGRS